MGTCVKVQVQKVCELCSLLLFVFIIFSVDYDFPRSMPSSTEQQSCIVPVQRQCCRTSSVVCSRPVKRTISNVKEIKRRKLTFQGWETVLDDIFLPIEYSNDLLLDSDFLCLDSQPVAAIFTKRVKLKSSFQAKDIEVKITTRKKVLVKAKQLSTAAKPLELQQEFKQCITFPDEVIIEQIRTSYNEKTGFITITAPQLGVKS